MGVFTHKDSVNILGDASSKLGNNINLDSIILSKNSSLDNKSVVSILCFCFIFIGHLSLPTINPFRFKSSLNILIHFSANNQFL